MREIKFRAWNDLAKRFSKPFTLQNTVINYTDDDGLGVVKSLTDEIVYQFTGLKDKNGVDIYEGDIQKVNFGRHCWIYVVQTSVEQFGNQLFSIRIKDNLSVDSEGMFNYKEQESQGRDYIKSGHNCEVIGNIHENKELLK